MKEKIICILTCTFIIGFILGASGIFLSQWDNEDYSLTFEEHRSVEEIHDVLEYGNLVYVCYNDGSYVNTYDRDGNFQWCVSAPYMRNCNFAIIHDSLVIYHHSSSPAYTYDAQTGAFLSAPMAETLELSYLYTPKKPGLDGLSPGQIGYDTYNVYKISPDGQPEKIVSRPGWYILFHFLFAWVIAFSSALTIFLIKLWERVCANAYSGEANFSPRVKLTLGYIKIITVINAVQSVLNFIILPRYPIGVLITFALVGLFIVPGWILSLAKGKLSQTDNEGKAIEKWHTMNVISIIILFLSTVIALVTSA